MIKLSENYKQETAKILSPDQCRVTVGSSIHFGAPILNKHSKKADGGLRETFKLSTVYNWEKQGYLYQNDEGQLVADIRELNKDISEIKTREREAKNLDEQKQLEKVRKMKKLLLPVVMVAGDFLIPLGTDKDGSSIRKAPRSENIIIKSGRLPIDIDGLGEEKAIYFRERFIQEDPHTEKASISTSRDGLHLNVLIGYWADEEAYKKAFKAYQIYAKEVFGVTIDEACSDPRRLSFLAYDPDLKTKDDAVPLDVRKWVPKTITRKKKQKPEHPGENELNTEQFSKAQPNFTEEVLKKDAESYLVLALEQIRQAVAGSRHKTNIKYAYSCGGLVAGGSLDRDSTLEQLIEAARENHPEDPDAEEKSVQQSFAAGQEKPYWRNPIFSWVKEHNFLLSEGDQLSDVDEPRTAEAFAKTFDGRFLCVQSDAATFHQYDAEKGTWSRIPLKVLESQVLSFLMNVAEPFGPNNVITSRLAKSVIQSLGQLAEFGKQADDWKWNPHPTKLVLGNGILDLNSLLLQPEYDQELFCTKRLDVDYNPSAECPKWKNFLEFAVRNELDRKRLQEWAGYLIYPEIRLQKVLLIYGDGENGKGVFTEVIQALFDDSMVSHVEPSKFKDQQSVTQLEGASLNVVQDASTSRYTTEEFKKIVAGEPTEGKRVFQNKHKFRPNAKHLITANKLPSTNDRTKGFYRRFDCLEFRHCPPPGKKVERLFEIFIKEELEGVLLWALEGLKRLRSQKWKMTNAPGFAAGERALRIHTDPLQQFLDECCDVNLKWEQQQDLDFSDREAKFIGEEYLTSWNDFVQAYQQFCKMQNFRPLNAINLKEELEAKSIHKRRRRFGKGKSGSGRERVWVVDGVQIIPEWWGKTAQANRSYHQQDTGDEWDDENEIPVSVV